MRRVVVGGARSQTLDGGCDPLGRVFEDLLELGGEPIRVVPGALDRPFDDFEIQLATQTSEKLGAALARVEQQWAEQNAKDVAELTELYASNEDEAAKAPLTTLW